MTAKQKKKRGLGKGLSALIKDDYQGIKHGYIPDLDINKIVPNPKQPRTNVNPELLIGLADSIRAHGVLEPLIVTKTNEDTYQLVAGERRWRASKLARLETVPVVVKEVSPREILEIAIIENIQRKDLNPLEEAIALNELYSTYRVKLGDLSKKLGKDTSTLSNKMRLLKLPENIQNGILNEKITESHAYQILKLKSKDAQLAAYNIIARKNLSVNQTEELIRKITMANKEEKKRKDKRSTIIYDEKTVEIKETLEKKFGKKVKIIRKKDGGRITLPFNSDKELDRLYKFLMQEF